LDRSAVPIADARAQRQGVRFGLENHWYTEIATPRDVLAALDACSPAVGAAIDTGHFAFLGCDLAAAARLLGPRVLHVHLKVVRRPATAARLLRQLRKRHHMEPSLPGPRDGLDGFASALRAAGYAGMLAVEHEGRDDLSDALTRYRRRAETLAGSARPAPSREAVGAWSADGDRGGAGARRRDDHPYVHRGLAGAGLAAPGARADRGRQPVHRRHARRGRELPRAPRRGAPCAELVRGAQPRRR